MYHAPTNEQSLSAYDSYITRGEHQEISEAAADLEEVRVAHINTTASGGGVAEMLHGVVPLANDLGVETDWLVMEAPEDFYDVTKSIHNGLQGDRSEFTDERRDLYRSVTRRNAEALDEAYDVVILHDPQTLGMIPLIAEEFPETSLVWRCHIDLTDATPVYLAFVQEHMDDVDAAVFTLPEYGESISEVDKVIIYPAIDPLTEKNCPLEELSDEAAESTRLEAYPFDSDRPLLVQISRFDPWKDPMGVIETYRTVTESVPEAQLALVGAMPEDDPEGIEVFREVEGEATGEEDIHLLTNLPDAGINVIQRQAAVVLQKSFREGFALTVSEALWKGTPVVGADVGGIPLQIEDGENGYLVDPRDIDATAERVTRLLADDDLRARLGDQGRETVREHFLTPRLVSDFLALLVDVTDEKRVR